VGRRYTLLGWVVWRVARWYARKRIASAKRTAIALAVVAGVVGAGLAAARPRGDL
jgi:hypothetical protein